MDEEKFGGFTPPVSNYFRMPNEWINICAEINSLAELKVVQYVLRHTWGFREYDGKPKPITIDEFMNGRLSKGKRMDKGTGLSKQSVVDGVKNAIKHSYLICEIDDSDKARIIKSYALNMVAAEPDVKNLDIENEVQESGCQESRQQMSRKSTANVKEVDSKGRESRQRSEKDTGERHFGKEREKDSAVPVPVQETSPSLVLDTSLSLSSQKNEKKTTSLEEWYSLFDRLLQEKGYPVGFKVPRNEKNAGAIQELISMNATAEQASFVLNHIWNDKDPFWRQHRGKISTVASQFENRVGEMTAPSSSPVVSTSGNKTAEMFAEQEAIKQRILQKEAEQGGRQLSPLQRAAQKDPSAPTETPEKPVAEPETTNEPAMPAKAAPSPSQSSTPVLYGPKKDTTPTYTRLKIEKPARSRTLFGRMQTEQKDTAERI